MTLLSFAVADRFEQTQRKLAAETEQRRAMEDAYADEPELEVRERTRYEGARVCDHTPNHVHAVVRLGPLNGAGVPFSVRRRGVCGGARRTRGS